MIRFLKRKLIKLLEARGYTLVQTRFDPPPFHFATTNEPVSLTLERSRSESAPLTHPAQQAASPGHPVVATAQSECDGVLDAAVLYTRGREAQQGGDLDRAFSFYGRAMSLIHKYGPARIALAEISAYYYTAACDALRQGRFLEGKRLLVRAVECNLENTQARSSLENILAREKKRDLTKHCFVFHDPPRAETVHREAVLRCLEYVSIAGVVGDILEFGVLAGWSARIFCETMRDLMNLNDIHLFDSFEGLPEYTSAVDINSYEIGGRNIWADKMRFGDEFIRQLGSSTDEHVKDCLSDVIRPERIKIHRGFFSETLKKPLNVRAALVHLDCDLYQSTVEVLWGLYEMNAFQDGCVLMFDDWNCNKASANYGERRAFREFIERQDRYTYSPFFTYGFNGAVFFLHDRAA